MPLLHSNPGASVIGCVPRWVSDARIGSFMLPLHPSVHTLFCETSDKGRRLSRSDLYLHLRSTSTHTTSDLPHLCPFDHRSTAVFTFIAPRVGRDHCDGLASSLCQIQSIFVLQPSASLSRECYRSLRFCASIVSCEWRVTIFADHATFEYREKLFQTWQRGSHVRDMGSDCRGQGNRYTGMDDLC